jgi:hypothetical protein
MPRILRSLRADVAIIGGGTGGVAAALAALRRGKSVVLTEETDWIGGQFTGQAVPPDEHPWIESFGCTRSYRRLRDDVRRFYLDHYPMTFEARGLGRDFNPGGGWVSRLCHEPRISHLVLQAHLQPFLASGRLTILLRCHPTQALTKGDKIELVTVLDEHGELILLEAFYFLDATELGDLLELAGVESVMGAESRAQTGEPHAPEEAQPLNQQSVSACFPMSYHEGENHVGAEPASYEFWKSYKAPFWPDHNLSWTQTHPITLATRERSLFPLEGRDPWEALFGFRQILDPKHFQPGFAAPVTLVNWPQIDYWLGPLVGVSNEERQKHSEGARQLSLSFFHWMQTEAPRHDGRGRGYPELRLRPDLTGTKDGLAKTLYIRESRRIQAEFTVVEQHVASELRPNGSERFADSVGLGCYRIDLHPSTGASGTGEDGDNYIDVGSWPFQIPLGALIPVRVENLLPACKNLGVTHITNGCYRLHPVEWNIGEAAGALAAHCLDTGQSPREVRNSQEKLEDFQRELRADGFELEWPGVFPV